MLNKDLKSGTANLGCYDNGTSYLGYQVNAGERNVEFCGKAHGYGFGVVNLQVWLLNQLPLRRDLERKAPDANGVNVKGYPDPLNPALKPAEIEYLASVIGDIDLSNPEVCYMTHFRSDGVVNGKWDKTRVAHSKDGYGQLRGAENWFNACSKRWGLCDTWCTELNPRPRPGVWNKAPEPSKHNYDESPGIALLCISF